MTSATSPSDAAIAPALASDLSTIIGKLKRRLRRQASAGDLTPSQVAVLLRLDKDGPATASGLARAEGMRSQSMGAVIAPLEAAGLLKGSPDPDDGRQTLLALTKSCRDKLEKGRLARRDWLARVIEARLSPGEQARLADAILLLNRLADD